MPEYKSTISPIFCPVSISAPSLSAGKKNPPEWDVINSSLSSLLNCNWYLIGFLRLETNTKPIWMLMEFFHGCSLEK